MTALPPATDFTDATVTEAQFKTAITSLRGFLAELLGTDGATRPGQNAIINGGCRVAQRGALTLVKDVYGFGAVDRFEGMATGTAVSAGTLAQATAAAVGRTGHAVHFSSVTLTGVGELFARTRIEARDAAAFKNQAATFSAAVRHDAGSATTWTVTIRKANAADDFSATTLVAADAGTSVASATSTALAFTVSDMGDVANGIEIEIKIAAGAVTAKNFWLAELQLEPGSAATPFDHRSYADELARCQRYYERLTGAASSRFALGQAVGATTGHCHWAFAARKRAVPTIGRSAPGDFKLTTALGTNDVTALSGEFITVDTTRLNVTGSGLVAGDATTLIDDGLGNSWLDADAEL